MASDKEIPVMTIGHPYRPKNWAPRKCTSTLYNITHVIIVH